MTDPDGTPEERGEHVYDLFKRGMDMLDQDAPFFVTGFTAHSPMWRKNVKGLALDKRVHVEWGRNETAWLDA